MSDYRFEHLTADDQAQIVAEYRARFPDPVIAAKAREADHFRAVLEAKLGLRDEMPEWRDDESPDVPVAQARHEALLELERDPAADVSVDAKGILMAQVEAFDVARGVNTYPVVDGVEVKP